MEKKQRGGARKGTGPKNLRNKKNRKLIVLSDTALERLEFYAKSLGYSQSDIIDALCDNYLNRCNKDIDHCPQCGKPIAWEALITVMSCEVTCLDCGYVSFVGDPVEERQGGIPYKEYFKKMEAKKEQNNK